MARLSDRDLLAAHAGIRRRDGLTVLHTGDRHYADHCTYVAADAPPGTVWQHTTISPADYLRDLGVGV